MKFQIIITLLHLYCKRLTNRD